MKQYDPNMVFLTKMDPLTLQAVVYICPDHELDSMFALIPSHVATTWVVYLLDVFRYRLSSKDEVNIYFSYHNFTELLKLLRQHIWLIG